MENQDWDPLAHIPAARAIITRSTVCLIYWLGLGVGLGLGFMLKGKYLWLGIVLGFRVRARVYDAWFSSSGAVV